MNRKNNIILIGFMGSGKTTFGRWIIRTHNMEFLDTDEYIENKYNKLIKDIFRDSGEETFRDMETQTIKELAQVCDNCVISADVIVKTDGRRFEDMYADIVSAVNIGIMED